MADLMFDRIDTNGDDFITMDEIPDRLKPLILASGMKIPAKISREEFTKIFEEARKRFPQRPNRNPDVPKSDEKKAEPVKKQEK
jgi:hypothetical protein